MKKIIIFTILIIIFLPGCINQQSNLKINNISMKLTSPVFENNQEIPSKYTCDGQNVNPPLAFDEVPITAQSLVLIVDDPDAPSGDWVHWLLWNIDPKLGSINENSIPPDAVEGLTSFGSSGYGGPCPPSGTHRYFFKLYALDSKLDLSPETKKLDLEAEIQKHLLASAELIGQYSRQ